MANKQLYGIERLFRGFFFVAVLSFVGVASIYFWHFGRQNRGFSYRVEDWAAFGEYIGGTLGGIYGLLAFIGVLITIVLLRGQLDFMRAQANRDELQRLMASISANIDVLLRKVPAHVPKEMSVPLKRSGAVVTVQHLIEIGAKPPFDS